MKALIVAAEGTTDEEFIYPFYRLKEAGLEVQVMIPGGGMCRGVAGVKIGPASPLEMLEEPHPMEDDLLVLPGGVKAIEKLRQHRPLIRHIAAHHAEGRVIASICHGAQLLISAKLCSGRRISGYYSIRDDIENAGGTYVDEPAVVCDWIVTTAHYKHMGPWMAAALREVGV